jgi:hypothetical protein
LITLSARARTFCGIIKRICLAVQLNAISKSLNERIQLAPVEKNADTRTLL